MPPPGLDLKEGRPPFAPLGRMDATSNRSDSPSIDCALRIPAGRPEVKTRNPNNNTLALQLAQTLEIGVVITDSLEKLCPWAILSSLSEHIDRETLARRSGTHIVSHAGDRAR